MYDWFDEEEDKYWERELSEDVRSEILDQVQIAEELTLPLCFSMLAMIDRHSKLTSCGRSRIVLIALTVLKDAPDEFWALYRKIQIRNLKTRDRWKADSSFHL